MRLSAAEALHHPFVRCLPAAIFELSDSESVMSVPGVSLIKDPVMSNRLTTNKNTRQHRRQSLVL